jgi:hypothetical protein
MYIPNRYYALVAAALFSLVVLVALLQTPYRRIAKRILLAIGAAVAVVVLSAGSWFAWTRLRPQPPPLQQTLFIGVEYLREVRQVPAPQVFHIIRIDTQAEGLKFLVTPGTPSDATPPREVQAMTTSQFLKANDLQIAINGDFFHPFFSRTVFDYYPREGDWVNILGIAASNGLVYSDGDAQRFGAIFFSKANEVSFDQPIGEVYNAISGDRFCLRDGEVAWGEFTDEYHRERQPRTVIGLSQDRRTLLLIVADGRQPNFSEGATLAEMAEVALAHGAWSALNMDGGGSTTLVVEDAAGNPTMLNVPIDNYIPGRERAVGNHLGIFAEALVSQ